MATAMVVLACTSQPSSRLPSPTGIANDIADQTLALYDLNTSGIPKCTGVWVKADAILTAAHCIDVGSPFLSYSTRDEYNGVYTVPKGYHLAFLVKADLDHDLALYHASIDVPAHQIAVLALARPEIGTTIFFTGHPAGIVWSFRSGKVSHYREAGLSEDYLGPWMQTQGPVYYGDSGGGAFNQWGELVGLSHSIATKIPDMAFFVTLDTMRSFLK